MDVEVEALTGAAHRGRTRERINHTPRGALLAALNPSIEPAPTPFLFKVGGNRTAITVSPPRLFQVGRYPTPPVSRPLLNI